ncbi:MAG: DnaJ domain-containing protein, partial [Blastocatellia bacterium]
MDKMASGPRVSARGPEKDFRSISQAYADIEFTLQQIEQPVTYYQLLGLTRKATKDEVVSAHQAIFERLNPGYYHLEDPMPDTIASRMERALLRLREAFEVLSDSDSRLKYDSLSRDSAVLPAALPGG